MKKLLRVAGILAAIIILFAVGVAAFYFLYYPKVEKAPQLTVERTLGRIERGKYLANHVTMCIECHSTRNFDYFAGPIVKGSEGKGGEHFGADEGVPADLYAPNITPAGVAGTLTDGELLRTITSGVRKDNSVLFPLMPYSRFNKLTDEDLYSIIAYVRTLPPIENTPPKSKINFPVNLFIRAVPTTHTSVPEPNRSNKLEYGKYLVNAAVCAACHTPMEKGQPKQGMDFAGGREFITTFGTIRTANITPDEQTGIGNWTEDF
ncbi:MAG TPA: cytochrome C, partial [Bacteroidota bacterium]|nr:cytochrome C [Bacteroidota bacterium]